MKKLFQIISVTIVTVILTTTLVGCSTKEWVFENFTYAKYGEGNEAYVEITGLSLEGNYKELLIVPKTIDGLPVKKIIKRSHPLVMYTDYSDDGFWHSQSLKKLYFYESITVVKQTFVNCSQLEAIFVINADRSKLGGSRGLMASGENIYIHSSVYALGKWSQDVYPANVTYYYNYEGAENGGCFWLDNLASGEKISCEPPTIPIRTDFEFVGWYKEPECTNEWNFAKDVMPNYNDYYELKLYAKWN